MKKIIQIVHTNCTEYAPDSLYALTEDGKIYYWGYGYKEKVVPATSPYAPEKIRSTGEKIKVYGWIELVDEINTLS